MKPLSFDDLHASQGDMPSVIDQAIDWLVRLQSGQASTGDYEACRRWREARPAHALAWEQLQGIQGRFAGLPAAPARATLESAQRDMNRRRALRVFGVVMGGGVAAWLAQSALPVDRMLADYSTGTGEQRRILLPDGTQLMLNTQTSINLRFDDGVRRIVLREGQLAVTTGADAGAARYRPLTVQTGDGGIRALGTRFEVQRGRFGADRLPGTRVQVREHAVELQPAASALNRRLEAGEQAWFDEGGIYKLPAPDADSDAWTDGLLVARDMLLEDFAAELNRYRPGHLTCDASAATLRISGVFSLADTERTLALVEKTLPIRVNRRTRYWVTLQARA